MDGHRDADFKWLKSPMLMGKWWVLSCKDFLWRRDTDILNQHAYSKSPCLNQESYVVSQSLSVSTAVVQQSVDISTQDISRCVGTFWSAAHRCGIRVHFCGHIEQWLHTTETKWACKMIYHVIRIQMMLLSQTLSNILQSFTWAFRR